MTNLCKSGLQGTWVITGHDGQLWVYKNTIDEFGIKRIIK